MVEKPEHRTNGSRRYAGCQTALRRLPGVADLHDSRVRRAGRRQSSRVYDGDRRHLVVHHHRHEHFDGNRKSWFVAALCG